jgi:hypothetical protein
MVAVLLWSVVNSLVALASQAQMNLPPIVN